MAPITTRPADHRVTARHITQGCDVEEILDPARGA